MISYYFSCQLILLHTHIRANADPDSGHEKLEFLKGHKNLLGLSITEFPVSVFNDLTEEWYGLKLDYLQAGKPLSIGEIKLKAAAEPPEPDDYQRDETNDPVMAGRRASEMELEDIESFGNLPSSSHGESSGRKNSPTTPVPYNSSSSSTSSPSEQRESKVPKELFPVTSPATPNQQKSTTSLLQAGIYLLTPEKTPEQNKETTTIQASQTLSGSPFQTPTSIFSHNETSGIKRDSSILTADPIEEAMAIGQELGEKQKRPRPEAPPDQEITKPANKKYSNRSRSPSPGFDS